MGWLWNVLNKQDLKWWYFRSTYSLTLKVLMRKARATSHSTWPGISGNFFPSHQGMPRSLAFKDTLSQKHVTSFRTGFMFKWERKKEVGTKLLFFFSIVFSHWFLFLFLDNSSVEKTKRNTLIKNNLFRIWLKNLY